MKGFLAWDDAISGKRPGILVVHEWWGLNDYARSRAKQLAELGYTALAVDMYGEGKAAEHERRGRFRRLRHERSDCRSRSISAACKLKSGPPWIRTRSPRLDIAWEEQSF